MWCFFSPHDQIYQLIDYPVFFLRFSNSEEVLERSCGLTWAHHVRLLLLCPEFRVLINPFLGGRTRIGIVFSTVLWNPLFPQRLQVHQVYIYLSHGGREDLCGEPSHERAGEGHWGSLLQIWQNSGYRAEEQPRDHPLCLCSFWGPTVSSRADVVIFIITDWRQGTWRSHFSKVSQ